MFINKDPHLGVALYVKSYLNPLECNELNNHNFQEAVWCKFITVNNEKILIGVIYKSPNSTDENVDNLINLLAKEDINKFDKVCIVGDFNYPNIKWEGLTSNIKDKKFLESIRDNFLQQMVKNPTRRREGQRSTLDDLVLVNSESIVSEITHCNPLGKSDHDVLKFDLYIEKSYMKREDVKLDLKKGNYCAMKDEIGKYDWQVLHDMNVEDCWITIRDCIIKSMEDNIPKARLKGHYKQNSNWINVNVKKNISKKRKLFKKYLNTKSDYDYKKYKTSRNICNKSIIKAKREYERNIAKNSKDNPKQFWKFVQDKTKLVSGISPLIDSEGKTVVTDSEKANVLNSFFSSVFTKENLDNIPEAKEDSRAKGIRLTDIQVLSLIHI